MMLRDTSHVTAHRLWAAALCFLLAMVCCGCTIYVVPDEPEEETVVVDVEPVQPEEGDQAAPETSDEEDYTLSGTLAVLTAEEVLEMQGSEMDPSVTGDEPDDLYAILLFDEPQVLYSHAPGDPDEMMYRETDMLLVANNGRFEQGDITQWEPYDGKQVTVQVSPYDIWNPSDARLPVGCPRANNVVFISAE